MNKASVIDFGKPKNHPSSSPMTRQELQAEIAYALAQAEKIETRWMGSKKIRIGDVVR